MSTGNNSVRPCLPQLCLRVGVTGARDLRADQHGRIEDEVAFVLRRIRNILNELGQEESVRGAYAADAAGKPALGLRVITPLARGADRLVAHAASAADASLYVPMPFPRAQYEQDFVGTDPARADQVQLSAADDLREFRDLLGTSPSLALDGEREDPEIANLSYQAVGRFVDRHSDLLIAVWDGKQAKGLGGTADIVQYAAAAGVPIWWIHAENDVPPVWIAHPADLRNPIPGSIDAEARLVEYLGNVIRPRPLIRRQARGPISWLAMLGLPPEFSPAAIYCGTHQISHNPLWTAHSRLMRWAGGRIEGQQSPVRPANPVAGFWFDHYQRADRLAIDAAARYRSSYVLVIFLATFALIFGAIALGLALPALSEHKGSSELLERISLTAALFELATLIGTILLVCASLRHDWHARSIDFRLLAELFRKQETLAPLGWTLATGNVQHLADTDRLAWVGWLFAAVQRSAPLPQGDLLDTAGNRQMLENLVREQLQYHEARCDRDERASETFEQAGGVVFAVVLLCVIAKIISEWHGWRPWIIIGFGLFATVLPGVSAAIVGIRRYAELELLADQSKHMMTELNAAQLRIGELPISGPLVSQALGAEAAALADTMLQDLEGWGRLFRGKPMEAG